MSNFDPSVPAGIPGNANTDAVLNFNGSSYDIQRANLSQVLLAPSGISASTAISVTNFNARGFYAFMNITSAFPGSGSTTLALKIKALPPGLVTASAVTIAAIAARSASGIVTICMYPGAIAGSASADALITTTGRPAPRDFLVVASYSSAAASASLTVSLGLMQIL